MSWTLQIQEPDLEPIVDGERLRLRLQQLNESAKLDPLIVVMNAPDGSTLAIGVGREMSVLSYAASGGWPSKHVINDKAIEELLSYKFLGHFTEIPARYAVPIAEAIDAAVNFFKTGKLASQLHWQDD